MDDLLKGFLFPLTNAMLLCEFFNYFIDAFFFVDEERLGVFCRYFYVHDKQGFCILIVAIRR